MKKKIAVIGGGWYGAHIALELAGKGYEVSLFERNSALFSETSGLFGIRLHIGPHYPRSPVTRQSCLHGFLQFSTQYPELIVSHDFSVYAVGNADADNEPSKVDADEFVKICKEYSKAKVIDNIEKKGFASLEVAVELAEPSIYVGRGLHDFFETKLRDSGVRVIYNSDISSLNKNEISGINVESYRKIIGVFDEVVNTTSFQSLLPGDNLRLPFEVFYQPCLALVYKDTTPTAKKPFSFIVMDGWFPCLMPVVEYGEDPNNRANQYILTHGKWTIVASYKDVNEARTHLSRIDDEFIQEKVKPECEREIKRFFPAFEGRFEYVGWRGSVLAKIKNNREFRSSVTFRAIESGVIHVVPGKVSNIFHAADEVNALIVGQKNELIQNEENGYLYVKEGMLDLAFPELGEAITGPNTCDLQTFNESASDTIAKYEASHEEEQKSSTSMFSLNKFILPALATLCLMNESRENPNELIRYSSLVGLLLSTTSVVTTVLPTISFKGSSIFQWPTLWSKRNSEQKPALKTSSSSSSSSSLSHSLSSSSS